MRGAVFSSPLDDLVVIAFLGGYMAEIKTVEELWNEIERLSRDEVIIHHAFQLQRVGEFSREYTAMAMVLALHGALKMVREDYLNHVACCASPPTFVKLGMPEDFR